MWLFILIVASYLITVWAWYKIGWGQGYDQGLKDVGGVLRDASGRMRR